MKRVCTILLIVFSVLVNAQTKTVLDSATFAVENTSMWGPNSAFNLNRRIPLFDPVIWNSSINTGDAGISRILDARFGAGLKASTSGKLAMEFYLEGFSLGEIDVTYPVSVELTVPDDNTFSPGSEITISSGLTVNDGWKLDTRYPALGAVGLDFIFSFNMAAEVNLCFVDCAQIPILPPGFVAFNDDTLQIIRLSGIPGDQSFYPCNTGFCTTEPPRPLEFDGGVVPLSGYVDLPYVQTGSAVDGQNLVANGESRYFEMDLNIIGLLAMPPGSPFRALQGEIPIGPGIPDVTGETKQASLEYSFFSTNFVFGVTDKQNFKFEPTVYAQLGFPVEVEYQERKPSGAVVGNSGKSDTITFTVGNDLIIRYPCDYDFMDVSPVYSMTNEFSNRTYDTFGGDLALSALSFGINIPEFVLVPRLCTPRVCVFGACIPSICTPKIASPEISIGFGPVWSENVPLFAIDLDYFNDSWEIPGFNNDINGDVFRLTSEPFVADLFPTDVNCFGDSTGLVEVELTSGTAPFTYRWSDGDHTTDSILNGVPAGTYYLKVTDNNGCTALASTEIDQNPEIFTRALIDDLLCYEDTDGEVDLFVTGGVPPYNYSWTNGASTQDISGLSAGEYAVVVTDDSNCVKQDTFTINEPKELVTFLSTKDNPSCFGFSDGSILYESYGGTPPYTYDWSSGDNTPKATSLTAGMYNLTVTDVNDCSISATESLTDPEQLIAEVNVTNEVSCKDGSDGALELSIAGGTQPYDIQWFKSENKLSYTVENIIGQSTGQYVAIVTDNQECVHQAGATLPEPERALSITLSKTDVSCFDGSDGTIESNVIGGTPPYSYDWSNGSSSPDPIGLMAGTHQVTVTDDNECLLVDRIVLFQEDPILISFTTQPVSCEDKTDGIATASATGGVPPYEFFWDNGQTTQTIEDQGEGNVFVTVTDTNSCQTESSVYIEKLYRPCFHIPSGFTPNGDGVNDTWIIRNAELYPNMEVMIFNKWDNEVFQSTGYSEPWDGTANGVQLPASTYYYTVDLKNGMDVFRGPVTIIRDKI